jgi:S1-C subfamily serine protease
VTAKLRIEDVEIRQGELHEFVEFQGIQRAVVPVLALQDGVMKGLGTAVCIGPGWFVTAKHVIDEHYDNHAVDPEKGSGLYVYIQTDEHPPSEPDAIFGALLEVSWINLHSETDLATMSTQLPAQTGNWLRHLPLALRMPDVGELVMFVGYPGTKVEFEKPEGENPIVTIEPHLTVSVGEVLSREPIRRFQKYRGSPGFESDAPGPWGMSGGAVLDAAGQVVGFLSSSMELDGDPPASSTYAAAVGPVLELNVMVPSEANSDEGGEAMQVAHLVMKGHIDCDVYPTFDVDPDGSAIYQV